MCRLLIPSRLTRVCAAADEEDRGDREKAKVYTANKMHEHDRNNGGEEQNRSALEQYPGDGD